MIIVVAQRIPFPPNKGEKLRTYHHIKYLVECGHKVRVLSLRHERKDDELAFELARSLNIKVELFSLPNILWRYTRALLTGIPMSVSAFHSKTLSKTLGRAVEQNGDVKVLFSASSLAPYALNNRSVVENANGLFMDFMDVDSDKWKQYANAAKWPMTWLYHRESKGIRKLERKINQLFTKTFLITEAEITLFEREVCSDKKVAKLANGMDFESFYPGKHEQKAIHPTFLFTGVMDYKPNVDAVLWFMDSL